MKQSFFSLAQKSRRGVVLGHYPIVEHLREGGREGGRKR